VEKTIVGQTLTEKDKAREKCPSGVVGKTGGGSAAGPLQSGSWLKGSLGMAICCGTPLLLLAAIAFFGLSLGAIASGALTLGAFLACPVGMFLMMRMMMKDKSR